MSTHFITLSSSGLKNITMGKFTEDDDFILIFGKQEIRMNRIFAEFISPIVSQLHYSDPTINSIKFDDLYQTINSSKASDFNNFVEDIFTDDTISLIQQISSGFSMEINDSQAFKLRFISIILGNEELFNKINELFPPDFSRENLNTYIEFIQSCYYFAQFMPDFNFSSLIDYLSNNFYLIDSNTFLKLPRMIQYLIISNQSLQIKSEDSLLDLVIQIISDDYESSEKVSKNDEEIESISFLEQIEFTGLSEEKLRDFLSYFDINQITNSLWQKMYQCFFIHFNSNPERIESRHSNKQNFEYIENQTNRFNGIIHFLTEKFGGNVCDNNICKVTSPSVFRNHIISNAFNYSDLSVFFSTDLVKLENSWLKIDFIGRKVRPSFYSIRTWHMIKGRSHLKSWVIEGSNTDNPNDWKILDSRNNESCLDDSCAENTFKIQTPLESNEYFRYLRIRQTGFNSKNTYQLILNALEFFGEII